MKDAEVRFKHLAITKCLVDDERMKAFLHWYDRRIAKLEMDKENFNSEVGAYKVVSRFSAGFDDWSFLYGSTGTV